RQRRGCLCLLSSFGSGRGASRGRDFFRARAPCTLGLGVNASIELERDPAINLGGIHEGVGIVQRGWILRLGARVGLHFGVPIFETSAHVAPLMRSATCRPPRPNIPRVSALSGSIESTGNGSAWPVT